MKIAIGSDHAGFELKEFLRDNLKDSNIELTDYGTKSEDSVDYPEYGFNVANDVSKGIQNKGILVCGSGIGMSIIANKVDNIRAALCLNEEQAKLSRQHNNSNVLVLAGRMTDKNVALQILNSWLSTDFEGGRHERRIEKIHNLSGK